MFEDILFYLRFLESAMKPILFISYFEIVFNMLLGVVFEEFTCSSCGSFLKYFGCTDNVKDQRQASRQAGIKEGK